MTGIVVGHCPNWITEELLAKVLQGDEEEETTDENRVVVYQIKADPAVAKGENFSSDLTRVSVKFTKGHKKGFKFAFLIFKSDLIKDNMDTVMEDFDVVRREIGCYKTVLPRVYALLQSIGDETCKLSPVCHKIDENAKPRYFVFEDLKHLEYKNVDRRVGLDRSHLHLTMIKLAKWHAATAHLALIDPATMKNHHYRNVSPDVKHFHAFFEGAMRSAAEVIRTWPGCEVFGNKLFLLADTIIEKNCKVFTRDEKAFNVLTHGDLWSPNLMFKHDAQGRPEDVVFVDYAVGFYGSPGIDLSYLLFTTTIEENTEVDWDRMLRVYHTELVSTLKKLEFTGRIPTMLDIYVEYLQRCYYGLMITTFLIPLRLLEDTKDADLSGLLGDGPEHVAFRKMLFGAPKYRDLIEPLLKFWDSKGLLDA